MDHITPQKQQRTPHVPEHVPSAGEEEAADRAREGDLVGMVSEVCDNWVLQVAHLVAAPLSRGEGRNLLVGDGQDLHAAVRLRQDGGGRGAHGVENALSTASESSQHNP